MRLKLDMEVLKKGGEKLNKKAINLDGKLKAKIVSESTDRNRVITVTHSVKNAQVPLEQPFNNETLLSR